jgi:hypothetical protein
MKVTLDLLKEWGACEDALEWFAKDYPDGVDEPLPVLCDKVIPKEHHFEYSTWLLHEVAAREKGLEGDEALAMLVERADDSRLARAVMRITLRDTSEALARLVKEGSPEHLVAVLERGAEKDAAQAAEALTAKAPAIAKFCERTLQPERAAFITAARRAG